MVLTAQQAQQAHDDMERDLLTVFTEEPLLGTIGLYITKRADPTVPTAYVTVDKNMNITMEYNLEFMGGLTSPHRKGVIRHEYYHLLALHIFGRMPTDPTEWTVWNWAVDLVVDYYVSHEAGGAVNPDKHLPDFVLFPGRRPKNCDSKELGDLFESFPVDKDAEWYFERLKKFADKRKGGGMPQIGEGQGTLDDHSKWGAGTPEEREILNQRIEGMIQEGMRRAQEVNNWGSVPASMQAILAKMFSREVDWKTIVRQFFGRARATRFTSTVRRLNRRQPYVLPGTKRKTKAEFAFFIDQSGSMSDDDVRKGFANVTALSGETTVDCYNFDTEVDIASHKVWKCGKEHPWSRTRSGGTDFDCVRRFVSRPENVKKWTGIVIFTDGYAAALGAMPGNVKVLWVITPGGSTGVVREGDLVVQLKNIS